MAQKMGKRPEEVQVPDFMLQQLMDMQTVDIVTLLPPLKDNGYGVSPHVSCISCALAMPVLWALGRAICSV